MKLKGPIITLAAGLVLAAGLLAVDLSVTHKRDAAQTFGAAPVSEEATPTPTKAALGVAPTKVQPSAVGTQITYAGKAGTANSIAIAIKDGQAVAYLCDGHTAEAWLKGTVAAGTITLTGAKNASLTGTLANGVSNGTVKAAGKEWTYTAKVVAPPSGLYRAAANVRGANVVGGWIVLDNGAQVGMVDYGDHEESAPALSGTTTIIDGTTITATSVDGSGL